MTRYTDFTTVTEVPGNRIRGEALEELVVRYEYAASLCRDRDVLEVACGAGLGLGRLGSVARLVVGGDYSQELLSIAHRHYKRRVPLVRLDGAQLPFRDGSFDVVVLYEALYYLPSPQRFLAETVRLLRPGGSLVVCSTNVEWTDFNPSPHSVQYHSAEQLRRSLEHEGFRVEVFAAFPDRQDVLRDRLVSVIRRVAVACRLVPRTMTGKEWLKRVFYGALAEVPPEVPPASSTPALVVIPPDGSARPYKVIYALAHR